MTKLLKLLGYIWALPLSLIGIALFLVYKPKSVKWSDGALDCVIGVPNLIGGPWVGAQTHGWVIFYKDEYNATRKDLRIHERVHVRDALIGGIFFSLAYVAVFLYELVRLRDWRKAYRNNWFERRAYDAEKE